MDKDIEMLIAEEKCNILAAEQGQTNDVSNAFFATAVKASELIDTAFNQAVITKIAESDDVKSDLLNTAEKVIKNQTDAISSDAEAASKKAHFNNKKGACECFGYNEETTEKWAVNVMNVWHNVMTAIWMFIGFFTFAPITFVAKKISVIFKKTWLAVLFAIIIYLAVVFIPIIITLVQEGI